MKCADSDNTFPQDSRGPVFGANEAKMIKAIAEDIEDVAQPGPGEELLIQISY